MPHTVDDTMTGATVPVDLHPVHPSQGGPPTTGTHQIGVAETSALETSALETSVLETSVIPHGRSVS